MKKLRLFLANVAKPIVLLPQAVPPMGILSLAAYLRTKFDLDIQLLNQRLEACSVEEVAQRAIAFNADIVGFGALTSSAHHLGAMTQTVREALPNALITVGGPCVTAAGMELFRETMADAAVPGEGELALEAIIRAWYEGDRQLGDIPGIFWRDRTGELIQNPGQIPIVKNLDDLPYPAYDLIDVPRYWKATAMTTIPNRRYISVFSSRGCPFNCIFCQHQLGKGFRPHSAERLVEEIHHYVQTYHVDTIEVLDDAFNFDRTRVLEFSELLLRRNLKVNLTFPNGVRADILNEATIDALIAAGMDQCTFALESGSSRIQTLTGKRLNIEKFTENVRYAVGRGVFSYVFNMLGFPSETEDEMRQTIDLNLELPHHMASFFTAIPFPGTRMYDFAVGTMPERLAHLDYRDMEFSNAHVNLSAVSDETLFACQREAVRRFYLNPRRFWRIFRDHPRRWYLARYGAVLFFRLGKGLFR